MAIASLGARTDIMLLALAGSSVVEDGGLVVVRTPDNPAFWWGNFVLAPDVDAVPDAVARFAREHPDARHLAIGVDGTDGAPGVDPVAAALGATVERTTVLTAISLVPPARPNTGAEIRRLESDADFAQCAELQLANFPAEDRSFVDGRVAAWRALQAAGHGGWFGAFLDERMRAGLGLFTDGSGAARFQAVDTHPDFRRRGLAGTLVHHVGTLGLTWPGVERLVIVAEPGDDAIRIYRAVGFDGTETQVQLQRAPAVS